MALDLTILTEDRLKALSIALGARSISGWSKAEELAAMNLAEPIGSDLAILKRQVRLGEDPLGETFCFLRPPKQRREQGATYTPQSVASAMVDWVTHQGFSPQRIVDAGAGSGRFLRLAGKRFPRARLVGVESDPVAAMMARANLAVEGFGERAEILCDDYRKIALPQIDGQTLFIGNPPYVRHHQLDGAGKLWLSTEAKRLGYGASQLAGLHVHFFLATALKAREKDFGIFVTSAEWLDVNYGKLVRQLFLGELGGQGITVVEPTSRVFEDAATTVAITQFVIGSKPSTIRIRRCSSLERSGSLTAGRALHRNRLETECRWSHLMRKAADVPQGYVELGELCRVHRGAVTGANRFWIAGAHSGRLPASVLFRTVTKAKELFAAGSVLSDPSNLRDVIDIPEDLSAFPKEDLRAIDEFLRLARSAGVEEGYIAKNRKAWWSVGLRTPAPILATYMARRTPAFVRNLAGARHINIAHGLYPRDPLSSRLLDRLAGYLAGGVSLRQGRMYAGGLTKFEPREMERIPVPNPEMLMQMSI